jgi:hypothetical protein
MSVSSTRTRVHGGFIDLLSLSNYLSTGSRFNLEIQQVPVLVESRTGELRFATNTISKALLSMIAVVYSQWPIKAQEPMGMLHLVQLVLYQHTEGYLVHNSI